MSDLAVMRSETRERPSRPRPKRPVAYIPPPPPHPTPHKKTMEVIHETARDHNVSVGDLLGRCRKSNFVMARHDAIRRIKELRPHLSSNQIGAIMGLHRGTVLYALGRLSGKNPPLLDRVGLNERKKRKKKK